MADAAAIEGGFADPVYDSQSVFRTAMNVLASPGIVAVIEAVARPPAPLTAELGALALTLCDHDSAVWLDADLSAAPAVAEWLRFQTGAPMVSDLAQAVFAIVSNPLAMPALGAFAQGADEYPDRSTTLLVAVQTLTGGAPLSLGGPGIRDTATLSPAPLPADFIKQWSENRERFPRGIDIIFAAPGAIAGLPRSTRVLED
jgi:alpha-D-ribose 1-methylphosphonate 5-triphosphate synthase subunit PhnH